MAAIIGLCLLPFIWALMAAANKKHVEEHGVPMPSRKAMARIRRNARQKGISETAAYDQWIVNKRRRMPKTGVSTSRASPTYSAPEARKTATWGEAFPSSPVQLPTIESRPAPPPAERSRTPFALWSMIACALAAGMMVLIGSALWQKGERPETQVVEQPRTLRKMAEPAALNIPAAPARVYPTSAGSQPLQVERLAAVPPLSQASLPSPRIKTVSDLKQPASGPEARGTSNFVGGRRHIAGQKVPLRSEPFVGTPLVDRLGPKQVVSVTEQRGDWVRVRVEGTQKEGWLPIKRIGAEAGLAEPREATAKVAPGLTSAAVAKVLIAASIASYPGSCACPYQSDRGGRSCGRRSAYSRPGGYAPICYAKDVTPAMVAEYRSTR